MNGHTEKIETNEVNILSAELSKAYEKSAEMKVNYEMKIGKIKAKHSQSLAVEKPCVDH